MKKVEMSLLKEITDAAIDTNVEITTLLRKCKVLAARLKNQEFTNWVEHELNGYKSWKEVPSYRIMENIQSRGDFVGMFQSAMKNVPIPPSSIPEDYRESLTKTYFLDAISYYSNLIKSTQKKGLFSESWNADYLVLFGDKIYENMNCVLAWKLIPEGVIASLLDTVRNRVLSFALSIEAEAPDAGEAKPKTIPIANEKVTQIFNTLIQGNVTNLATGIQPMIESQQIIIEKDNLKSLGDYLKSIGLDDNDVEELKDAIQNDKSSRPSNDFGAKVKFWLGKMMNKAGTSAWNIATGVATQLLAKALSQYYGL